MSKHYWAILWYIFMLYISVDVISWSIGLEHWLLIIPLFFGFSGFFMYLKDISREIKIIIAHKKH